MIGAIHVANSILLRAKKENISITPNKLYCLVYILYSKFLYKYGTKLFNEPFSVTEDGPIVPSLYFKFNCYGTKEIIKFARDAKGNVIYVNSDKFNKCLDEVWFEFINYSANELYNRVTSDKSAYSKAITNKSNVINDSDILSVEISNNEKILERAKILKSNLDFNWR